MAKKAKRRKRERGSPVTAAGSKLELVEVGLADHVTDEDLDEHWSQQCAEADKEYRERLPALLARIKAADPLLLLAQLSYHSANPDGQIPEWTQPNPVLQYQVELVHALLLRQQPGEFAKEQCQLWHYHEIHDLVAQVSRALQRKRLFCIDPSASPQERTRHGVIEQIRSQTQVVRNWAYQHQIVRVVTDLFAPFDDRVQSSFGVTIGNLVAMGQNVITEVERRTQIYNQYLREIHYAPSHRRAVDVFCARLPAYADKADEIEVALRTHWGNLQDAKGDLRVRSEILLPTLFELSLDDFVRAYPDTVDPAALRTVLDQWSLEFGDLAGNSVGDFFLTNPVWTRSIIRLDRDHYAWPNLGLFYSYGLEMMLAIIDGEPTLKQRYHARRARYLEDEAERLFRQTFPAAKIYRGSQWTDPESGKQYENDLLVILDSLAFVIEAKGHTVSVPARRGGRKSLETKIEELLVTPSEQAQRFIAHLQKGSGRYTFTTIRGDANEIDVTGVMRYAPVGLTLDELFGVRASVAELRAAGFIDENASLVPSISLTDLDTVFDLLDDAPQIIHYLIRRAELTRNLELAGFESDLVALYVDTGLVLDDFEDNMTMLDLTQMSAPVDHYYLRLNRRDRPSKPRRRITQWWSDILSGLQNRAVAGWPDIAYILLNTDFEQQRIFKDRFDYVQRNVLRHRGSPKAVNSVHSDCGPPSRRDAIIGVAYYQPTRQERDDLFQIAINEVAQTVSEGLRYIVIIGVDVAQRNYPYSVLAIFSLKSGYEACPKD